jgi:hypothetical protein
MKLLSSDAAAQFTEGEPNCDAILMETPKFLDQAVLMLRRPFAGEKRNNIFAAGNELGSIAPAGIDHVRHRNLL